MRLLYLRLFRYDDAEKCYVICVSSLVTTLTSRSSSTNVVDDDYAKESSSSSSSLNELLTKASNNLGNVRYAQRRYDAAIEDYERALHWERRLMMMNRKRKEMEEEEDLCETPSDDEQRRHRFIGMLRNLGSAYSRVKDNEKALNCYQRSLSLLTEDGNDERRKNNEMNDDSNNNNVVTHETLSTRHNLGLILCRKGELNEGVTILEKCYDGAMCLKQQQQQHEGNNNNTTTNDEMLTQQPPPPPRQGNKYNAMGKLMLDLSSAFIGINQWERARDMFDAWRWEYDNHGNKNDDDDDDDNCRHCHDWNHPYARQAKTVSLRLLAYYDKTTDVI